ncbi:RagB/SusD family nutrient uptake outer membrane protein [uncultured Tenacibaculum sp.]|uniref:RagB/SusD family nutrient uptake outer membrane protein n=1 Tax=uncultured Tenacibaculum sp. TaxID=174713 RepID=UPI00260F543D|nr:RagB/SusD family nutrient uptake outer membrane protein [uncultured Tenacibaculum sp.]
MKNNINTILKRAGILSLAVSSLIFTSCEDELNVLPEDSPVTELVFSNGTLALGALEGMYSAAQQDDVLNGTLQLSGEWQSDNVDFEGTFPTFNEIRQYTILSTNTSINGMWDDNYETIASANLVIDNVPLVDDASFTPAQRTQAIAEARFMRALVYLNISAYFGQPLQVADGRNNLSVPLVTSSEIGLEVNRATLGEVHDFIESELLAIIPDLGAPTTRIKANSGAAKALLARLYLYQERFADAAQMADEVISDGFYALATDYTFYNQRGSTEHIFTLANNADDGQDSGEGFSGLTNPNPLGRGDAPFSDDLLAAYAAEPGDLRFTTLNQTGNDAQGNVRTFTSKFPDGNNDADDAPVIRITEMYLTRAEGNFRAGSTVGAAPLADINTLRTRAGLPNLTAVDLDIILNERRKELAFEGQRRMDLMRNGMDLRRPGQPDANLSAPGMDRTIFPIPQAVRDLSPFLAQNPGY